MIFTTFAESAPPCNGWYWVQWPGEPIRKVLLGRIPDNCEYFDSDTLEVEKWWWSWDRHGSPESLCMDCSEPEHIKWAPVNQGGKE